jgi:hypothetical protein
VREWIADKLAVGAARLLTWSNNVRLRDWRRKRQGGKK